MNSQYNAIIFDLDGTLLDSIKDIAISMNTVLRAKGLPEHSIEDYNQLVGSGAGSLVDHSIPPESATEELVAECLLEFKKIYKENWNIHSRVFDGIDDLLRSLSDENILVAVFSNKPKDFVQLCVKEYLADHPFTHVVGHDDNIGLKPDPAGALLIAEDLGLNPNEVVFVGDTGVDMNTALNANMLPVGVSWGFRPEELLDSGAKAILSNPSELLQLLRGA